jgi:hypothetical protein
VKSMGRVSMRDTFSRSVVTCRPGVKVHQRADRL